MVASQRRLDLVSLAQLDTGPGSLRVRVRIPKDQQEQPVLSQLIADYGVTITIRATLLSANAVDDGWFDLELQGSAGSALSAIQALVDLGADVWAWPDSAAAR